MLRRHWPLAVSLAVLWLTLAALLAASLAATDGHVVYALDDPYIHMAMAKNLARHGVFGVTRYEFTSTTSSPLWTLLIALLFAGLGVRDELPLLTNLALATGAVILVYRIIDVRSSSRIVTCGVLFGLIFLTPLPALVLSGTEHMLQTLLCLAFACVVARVAAAPEPTAAGSGWLYVLAPLATAARYEDLFLVAIAAMLLAARHRAREALIVVGVAVVPGLLYGILSASHGWSWLPNPLLAKGAFPRHVDSLASLAAYLSRGLSQLADAPPLFAAAVMAGIAAVLALDRTVSSRGAEGGGPGERMAEGAGMEGPYLVLLFAGTASLHLQLANIGSFYRYEAYLIALSVLGTGVCAASALGRWQGDPSPRWLRAPVARTTTVAVGLLVLLPLGGRAVASLVNGARATKNIYQQQVQMGRFLQRFYEGQGVAINDIGAVNYLADIHSLDLWGLSDREVSRLRRAGRYAADDIRELARTRGVRLAAVYESGFSRSGGLPGEWIKVGEWEIPDNFICGWATVSFWAVEPGGVPRLRRELQSFAGDLPRDVVMRVW